MVQRKEPTVAELARRVRHLEEQLMDMAGLPDAVARVEGALETLTRLVGEKLTTVQQAAEKATSVKSAIMFVSVVLVPILVALIGGYFVLKAGAAR